MALQPFAEQRFHFERQTQQDVGGALRTVFGRSGNDGFDFMIVEEGHHRGHHHSNRNAGIGQRAHRLQPPHRCRAARFHAPRQFMVQRGH